MSTLRRLLSPPSLLAFSMAASASPIATLPWNGHQGAVTFTFDDACASQVANVLPALKSRDIHATFFIPSGSTFNMNKPTWKQAAIDGNELANHTVSHLDLTTLADSKVATEIANQAAFLRNLDPSIEAVTLAYPFCATNAAINEIANRENIIARTCGGNAQFAWNTKPAQWMSATSFILQDDATAAAALTEIDKAAKDGTWFVTLNHGVGGDWLAVTTQQVEAMFDRAKASKVWIGTYQEVAAYWRASTTMDTVSATAGATSWNLKWTSPHPKMPRKVLLRVRLDPAIFGESPSVAQEGKVIPKGSDGSYVVDFMKLGMDVAKEGSASLAKSLPAARLRARAQGDEFRIEGLAAGDYAYALRSTSGRTLARGTIRSEGAAPARLRAVGDASALILDLVPVDGTSRRWSVLLPQVR